MSSEHFRRLLQHFYIKINTGHHADVYKKILVQLFDEVEVQPIHILALSEQPSVKNFNKNGVAKIIDRKKQALYKNTDFASVFLFGYLMGVLKRHDTQELKNLQARVMDNLDIFYGEKQSEDATKYKFVFEGIFQFCQYVMMHNYESSQIEKIFKSFYSNTFERRGLKKTQKQKYLTESQVFLSFILGQSGTYPSKKQICQPNSDIYELNSLQFCIVIDNVEGGEQWTIGQGQHHINIVKEKGQYTIYQQFLDKQEEHDDEMNEIWLQILSQSQHIRKQHNDRTTNLMTDLNIMEQICSPTKSVRSPKTDLLKGRKRIGDFF